MSDVRPAVPLSSALSRRRPAVVGADPALRKHWIGAGLTQWNSSVISSAGQPGDQLRGPAR
ncbi:hypothetical protein AB0C07_25465 [Actinoplanes missouriensis]|uniref:hypothetical protein n=1 Tax=Actinoplanes missouriensis TaxID=1866 RepID=UPI0033E55FB5